MAEWINANGDTILMIIEIIGGVIALLGSKMVVKWGWVKKKSLEEAAKKVEAFEDLFKDAVVKCEDKKLTPVELAQLGSKVLKGSMKEGPAEIVVAIADAAAKADPKAEKKGRPILKALGGLLLGRLGIPRL